ncbi:MAG: nuclear transport factor 2 family protein [Fimbriimonadaceae bacterium]|nr:MAG: nuclear transport factor 2 family protein [Fimbriimonadaceae bacterium]
MNTVEQLMREYVEAFNRHDAEGMLNTLAEDVVHEINEGETQIGLDRFREFKAHMDECYREQLKEVVYFANGNRGVIEFICEGEYIKTDNGLPEATGQKYAIRAAAFFEESNGRLSRVTSYYSLKGWIQAIS